MNVWAQVTFVSTVELVSLNLSVPIFDERNA